jgi:hypothetical protein
MALPLRSGRSQRLDYELGFTNTSQSRVSHMERLLQNPRITAGHKSYNRNLHKREKPMPETLASHSEYNMSTSFKFGILRKFSRPRRSTCNNLQPVQLVHMARRSLQVPLNTVQRAKEQGVCALANTDAKSRTHYPQFWL